jgi:hypothetical protein
MFIIDTTDEAEYHSPIAGLAAILADLLVLSDHVGLLPPSYVTVSATGHIGLQLAPDMGSINAVRVWAETFCAAMRSDTHECENGQAIWVDTVFDFEGVNVDVYAHIPVPEAEPITSTEQDSEPETVTPF